MYAPFIVGSPPLTVQEGSGTAVMSAYVEIVFDNTDGRFPVALS